MQIIENLWRKLGFGSCLLLGIDQKVCRDHNNTLVTYDKITKVVKHLVLGLSATRGCPCSCTLATLAS